MPQAIEAIAVDKRCIVIPSRADGEGPTARSYACKEARSTSHALNVRSVDDARSLAVCAARDDRLADKFRLFA